MRLYLTLFILLANSFVYSQTGITWSPVVTVANNSFGNLHPRIALDKNNNPLLVWGKSSGNKAYFSRWNGSGFNMPMPLNPATIPVFTDDWAGPNLAARGDTVYAVFKHTPEDTNHMYLVRSFDGGQNFAAPVRIDYTGMNRSRFPTVTINDAGHPVIGFMKFDMNWANASWVATRSMDYGNSFMAEVPASATPGGPGVCDCCPGAIVSTGNNVAMLYRNNVNNIRTIYAGLSNNGGSTFPANSGVDPTNWMVMSCPSSGPDGIMVGDSLYTVFMSAGGGNSRVYISKASLSSQQMTTSARLTGDFPGLSIQNYPRIAHAGNAAAVVWREQANGTGKACLKFTSSITSGFPAAYDTLAKGSIINTDVAMAPGVVHVVWQDNNSGSVMYRKGTYSNTPSGIAGVIAGTQAISIFPNPARDYFSVSAADIPHVESCKLLDVTGKVVPLQPINANGTITCSISDMAAGTYLVLINDKAGKAYSSKLTISAY